jgi:hypothetical protein
MSSAATSFDSSALGPLPVGNGLSMKKASKRGKRAARPEDMRAEYDFSKGVRNKYAKRFAQGTNLVLLEPDVADKFPNAAAVNKALRGLLKSKSARRTA